MITYEKAESEIKTYEDLAFVCPDECDQAFTYAGADYVIIALDAGRYGHNGWFLCDFNRYFRKFCTKKAYRALSEDFPSFEALANAPILDGKSIKERMGDGSVVFFEPVRRESE